MDPKDAIPYLDENTIGVIVILGSTYTGGFEDVKGMNDLCTPSERIPQLSADSCPSGRVSGQDRKRYSYSRRCRLWWIHRPVRISRLRVGLFSVARQQHQRQWSQIRTHLSRIGVAGHQGSKLVAQGFVGPIADKGRNIDFSVPRISSSSSTTWEAPNHRSRLISLALQRLYWPRCIGRSMYPHYPLYPRLSHPLVSSPSAAKDTPTSSMQTWRTPGSSVER